MRHYIPSFFSPLSSPFPYLITHIAAVVGCRWAEYFLQSCTNFSRLTGKAKRMKRKNPNKNYLVLFTSLKQAASSAGLAHFKPLHSHRKRTKPPSHSAHPAPRDVGQLISRIQQQARGAEAEWVHWLQTSTAPHRQQLSQGERRDQQLQGDKEHVGLHCFCASCVSTGLARPFPEEGRAGTQVRDQRYPDTAWGIA